MSMSTTHELWHKTTRGMSASRGFLARGTGAEMIDAARTLMRTETGAPVSYHVVPTGSHEGFAEPDLGPSNLVGPETMNEVLHRALAREALR